MSDIEELSQPTDGPRKKTYSGNLSVSKAALQTATPLTLGSPSMDSDDDFNSMQSSDDFMDEDDSDVSLDDGMCPADTVASVRILT